MENLPVLELDAGPASRRALLSELWAHRDVCLVLARTDFQVRYKRAVFGILWAVVVPLIQAAVLALIFGYFLGLRAGNGVDFASYVITGVVAWSYFSSGLGSASTAVVDSSALAEKVWFPRAILPLVPCLGALVGFGVSMMAVLVFLPIRGVNPQWTWLLVVPATVLLLLLTSSLSLLLAALHVYFRDVRYLVQAALVLWFYVTPILYRVDALGQYRLLADLNPMTGAVAAIHLALLGSEPHAVVAITTSVVATLVLLLLSLEVYRRHDRLFVDKL